MKQGCNLFKSIFCRNEKVTLRQQKKIETNSIILIFKNGYEFIDFIGLNKFCSILDAIFGGLDDTIEHKCVLLFVENDTVTYNNSYIAKDIELSDARLLDDFKLIDLKGIKPIKPSDLSEWINGNKVNKEIINIKHYLNISLI